MMDRSAFLFTELEKIYCSFELDKPYNGGNMLARELYFHIRNACLLLKWKEEEADPFFYEQIGSRFGLPLNFITINNTKSTHLVMRTPYRNKSFESIVMLLAPAYRKAKIDNYV